MSAVVNLDPATEKQIRTIGQYFKPAVLPKDLERGVVGICFDWCILQAVKHPDYRYVEGIATDPDHPDRWILHAWLTDGEHAYDPTWMATRDSDGVELPVPSTYIGIPMDTMKVVGFMRLTGYQGVLANRFRAPEIVEDILETSYEV